MNDDRSILAEAESVALDVIAENAEWFARFVVYAHRHGQWKLLRRIVERRARLDFPRIADVQAEL